MISVHKPTTDSPAILWWSGGITSAVACKIAIEAYGSESCRPVFIDTFNEDDDTYRFKEDCEKWYGLPIEAITALDRPGATKIGKLPYKSIQEVWRRFLSLNVATGAICSATLKRDTRLMFQKENKYTCQVFGFDIESREVIRASNMKKNYPTANPVFPLLATVTSKRDCLRIVSEAGIVPPRAYQMGLNNNNCLKTGCIQGGVGYWQLMRRLDYEKFMEMAAIEHELTNLKGTPVTMNKDQSGGGGLVFLMPHPDYPLVKDLSMMAGRPPKPLMECNGFCGINDGLKEEPDGINFGEEHTPTLFG